MSKASTELLEQGTQTPSPAPDLIPAKNEQRNSTGNSHSDWYNKRGHFSALCEETADTRSIVCRKSVTGQRSDRLNYVATLFLR